MAAVVDRFYATGRRKTSVARVWIRPGRRAHRREPPGVRGLLPARDPAHDHRPAARGDEHRRAVRHLRDRRRRRSHGPGRRGPSRLARALARFDEKFRLAAQEGRSPDARSADARTEEVRPAGRPAEVPVLEALSGERSASASRRRRQRVHGRGAPPAALRPSARHADGRHLGPARRRAARPRPIPICGAERASLPRPRRRVARECCGRGFPRAAAHGIAEGGADSAGSRAARDRSLRPTIGCAILNDYVTWYKAPHIDLSGLGEAVYGLRRAAPEGDRAGHARRHTGLLPGRRDPRDGAAVQGGARAARRRRHRRQVGRDRRRGAGTKDRPDVSLHGSQRERAGLRDGRRIGTRRRSSRSSAALAGIAACASRSRPIWCRSIAVCSRRPRCRSRRRRRRRDCSTSIASSTRASRSFACSTRVSARPRARSSAPTTATSPSWRTRGPTVPCASRRSTTSARAAPRTASRISTSCSAGASGPGSRRRPVYP